MTRPVLVMRAEKSTTRPQKLTRGGNQTVSTIPDDLEELTRALVDRAHEFERRYMRNLERRNRNLQRQLAEKPSPVPAPAPVPVPEVDQLALIRSERDPVDKLKRAQEAATGAHPITIQKDAKIALIAPLVEEVAARQRASSQGHYSPEEKNALDHDARHQGTASGAQMGGGRVPERNIYLDELVGLTPLEISERLRAGHGGVEGLQERQTLNRDPQHYPERSNSPQMGGTGSGSVSTQYVPKASGEASGSAQVVLPDPFLDVVKDVVTREGAVQLHPAKRNRRTK